MEELPPVYPYHPFLPGGGQNQYVCLLVGTTRPGRCSMAAPPSSRHVEESRKQQLGASERGLDNTQRPFSPPPPPFPFEL